MTALRRCVPTIAGLCLLTLAAPVLALAPLASAPARDLEPLPGTAVAERLRHHRAEADGHAAARAWLADLSPLAWLAADFAALPKVAWTVLHQDLTVELDVAKGLLLAEIELDLRAHVPGVQELEFWRATSDQTTISDADGVPLPTQFAEIADGYGLLTVTLPAPLTPDADVQLHVSLQMQLDCQPNNRGFLPCSLGETLQWVVAQSFHLRPAGAQHAPFTSDLHVLTPADRVAAAPGKPSGPDKLPDGRLVWHFQLAQPTEFSGFAIAPYQPFVAEPGPGGATVRVYAYAPYHQNAGTLADLAHTILGFYVAGWQALPWLDINVIQLGKSFGGGMAPQGGVYLYRDIFGDEPGDGAWHGANELLAHELAHQWWGNLVAPMNAGDVSLSESLAEFSSCLYTEKQLATRAQILGDNLSYVVTVPAKDDRPLGTSAVYGTPKYVPIVYHKGAVVLDMLRRELGEETMVAALAAYAKAFGQDYAKVQDLREAAEKASGRDLKWFFDQWFQQTGPIRAAVAARYVELPLAEQTADARWQVRLRLTQDEPKPKRFKLPLLVVLPGGKTVQQDVDVQPGPDGVALVTLDVPERPQRLRVDSQRVLLRTFATATPGDVDLNGLVDGADLVDLAFRTGRAVVMTGKNGQEFFFQDLNWTELHDLEPDLRVDAADRDVLEQWIGTEAETF